MRQNTLLISKIAIPIFIIIITLLLGSIVVTNTSALSYQSNTGVEFTINPTITISINGDHNGNLVINNLTPSNASDSNIINIVTESNAISGYSLYSTVGSDSNGTSIGNPSTELRRNGTDTTNKFTSITTNKSSLSDFDGSDWGYSYCNGDNTICTTSSDNWVSGNTDSTLSGYNGLPLYDSSSNNNNGSNNTAGIKLVDTTTSGSTTISFKIGAKASNSQIAGDYTNTINFIGVAKDNPEIKTLDQATYMQDSFSCLATPEGTTKSLIDARDSQSYVVARLADGNCWMIQNLAIAQGSVLTNELSNTDANGYTIPTDDLTLGDSYTEGRSHAGTSGQTGTGYWYNYCAASAGTVCSQTQADANYDICPKNWRLPTSHDEESEIRYYKDAFNPVAGGFYTNGGRGDTAAGYYWSATASSNKSQYFLYYNGKRLNISTGTKYYGFYIRCVRS